MEEDCKAAGYEWWGGACHTSTGQLVDFTKPPPTRETVAPPPPPLAPQVQAPAPVDRSLYQSVPALSQKIDYTKDAVQQAYTQTYEAMSPLVTTPAYKPVAAPGLTPAATDQKAGGGGAGIAVAGAGLLALLMLLR